jgi:hypothetical protein
MNDKTDEDVVIRAVDSAYYAVWDNVEKTVDDLVLEVSSSFMRDFLRINVFYSIGRSVRDSTSNCVSEEIHNYFKQ